MTSNDRNQLDSIAFGGFLAHLRARGFTIGVEQHLRLQQLLARVAGQCAPAQLKTLLCPLFATSRQQQQEFYRAFEEYFAIFQPEDAPAPPIVEPPPPEPPAPPNKRSFRVTAIVSLIALAIAAAVLVGSQRFRMLAGIERFELPAPEVSPLPTPPRAAPSETVVIIPIIPATPERLRDWTLDRRWRLRWIALLAPLLLFALWQLWRWRRRRPVIEKAQGRRPPFTWPIELEREEWRLDRTQTFYQAARGFRRRQRDDFERLDLPRTIDATIDARGYPTFRFRQSSRVPEYLALIDRASPHDHQARLFDELAQSLEREGLFIVRYFYDGDPRICRAAESGKESFLTELQRKYPAHRLIVLGDGARLLDPVSGAFNAWASMLLEWPERALLTPQPLAAWRRRERALGRQFTLLPATLAGLAELAERYDLPLRNEAPRGDAAGNAAPPPDTEDGVTIAELRGYLGPDAFQWLCAAAVYPELQWELTLRFIQLASPEDDRLDEAALWRLLRLPWFRQGAIPDEVRQELARALDPALDRKVREFLIEALERNPAEDGTFAADERRLDIAVQQAHLAGDDRRARKAAIEQIEHLPPEELRRDYTLLRLLEDRPTSLLALVLPARMRRLFYPAGISHFGMRWQAALALALLAALLAWGGVESLIRYRQSHQPKPTPAPTPNASPTPYPTISPTPSASPTPGATRSPTPKPGATPSPTPGGLLVGGPEQIGPPPDQIEIEQVSVPGGSFLMGSPESEEGRSDDEGPQRRVTVRAFEMGKYEVTQLQWRQVAQLPRVKIDIPSDPSRFKGNDLPVENISWNDAVEFCARLSKATGRQYRLPTEAEWEYAARAGTTGPYAGNLDAMGWYGQNSGNKTHPVGRKQANAWGLFDMHGNVWEWCSDWYDESYYKQGVVTNPQGPSTGSGRVIRGGGWGDDAVYCRSAYRYGYSPGYRYDALGFRLVRVGP